MGHVVCLCSFFIEIFHFVPYRLCIMDNQLGFQNKRQLHFRIYYETKSANVVSAVCIRTNFSSSVIIVLPWLVTWVLGTWLVVMVGSAEAMNVVRVVVNTLALVKPPRPLGSTELMVNGFRLKVSFWRLWYLTQGRPQSTGSGNKQLYFSTETRANKSTIILLPCMNVTLDINWHSYRQRNGVSLAKHATVCLHEHKQSKCMTSNWSIWVLTSARHHWRPTSGRSCCPHSWGSGALPHKPPTYWKPLTGSVGGAAARHTSPMWSSFLYLWRTAQEIRFWGWVASHWHWLKRIDNLFRIYRQFICFNDTFKIFRQPPWMLPEFWRHFVPEHRWEMFTF